LKIFQICFVFISILSFHHEKTTVALSSGVARGQGGHAPWGAGLEGATAHFCSHFKRVFKQIYRPKYA